MDYKFLSNLSKSKRLYHSGLLFFLLVYLQPVTDVLYAQNPSQRFQMDYKNHFLTLSTEDADIKDVLFKLADEAEIYAQCPSSLKKTITIDLKKAPLKEALDRLLRDLNYVIIYSGQRKNEAVISEVFVFSEDKKSSTTSVRNRRLTNRLAAYERNLETAKRNLSRVSANSRQGQRYSRRINKLEKNIENLRRQID